MYKFAAAGDGNNNTAFALGHYARDLTDEEYKRAEAAGLLGDAAKALFEHVPDRRAQDVRVPDTKASKDEGSPPPRQPVSGKDQG